MTTARYHAEILDQRANAFARGRRRFRWTATGAVPAVIVAVRRRPVSGSQVMPITAATLRLRINPVACGVFGCAGERRRPVLDVQGRGRAEGCRETGDTTGVLP